MGRRKGYRREEIVERAVQLFWEQGYESTSTRDLESAMGVNRFSLYAEFGSKKGLYEAALDRYLEVEVPKRTLGLEAPGAGLEEIATLLRRFAAAAGRPGIERGCLLCNAATERSGTDPATRLRVERYVGRLETAFAHALSGAVSTGDLPAEFDVLRWGRALTTTLMGMFVQLRSRVEADRIRDTAEWAIAQLASQRRPGTGS